MLSLFFLLPENIAGPGCLRSALHDASL